MNMCGLWIMCLSSENPREVIVLIVWCPLTISIHPFNHCDWCIIAIMLSIITADILPSHTKKNIILIGWFSTIASADLKYVICCTLVFSTILFWLYNWYIIHLHRVSLQPLFLIPFQLWWLIFLCLTAYRNSP